MGTSISSRFSQSGRAAEMARAVTAEVVWGERPGGWSMIPSIRGIVMTYDERKRILTHCGG